MIDFTRNAVQVQLKFIYDVDQRLNLRRRHTVQSLATRLALSAFASSQFQIEKSTVYQLFSNSAKPHLLLVAYGTRYNIKFLAVENVACVIKRARHHTL